MKKLNLSNISTTVGMPQKSGSLTHIQSAYQEALNSIVRSIISDGIYQSDVGYILHGCVNSGSGLNYNISEGAIFLNGEIYQVPAAVFTATGLQVAVGTITTTYFSDQSADPVAFTDGVSRNVHEIRRIVFAAGLSGGGDVNFSACVDLRYRPVGAIGQVVQWKIPTGTLSDYFTSGLGSHPLTVGWAIANGSNGTDNYAGKVMVGYDSGDSDFDTVGGTGGAKTHTLSVSELPAHDHVTHGQGPIVGSGTNKYLSRNSNTRYSQGGGADNLGGDDTPDTSMKTGQTGSGAAHNNLQPYKTVLFIQRIS